MYNLSYPPYLLSALVQLLTTFASYESAESTGFIASLNWDSEDIGTKDLTNLNCFILTN